MYMDSQKELTWTMCGILTDWLVQVHVCFHLMPETLFLTVNIINCFLSAQVVSLAKLQLVGITCLFIASKVKEIVSPSIMHFLPTPTSAWPMTHDLFLQSSIWVREWALEQWGKGTQVTLADVIPLCSYCHSLIGTIPNTLLPLLPTILA